MVVLLPENVKRFSYMYWDLVIGIQVGGKFYWPCRNL